MNQEEKMEMQIWDFIDGNASAEDISFVENLVRTNQQWQAKYSELLQLHAMMNERFELDEPSMSFTRNVMEEIGRLNITPATKNYINKNIIRSIGGFFILSLLTIFIYALSQVNWTGDSGTNIDMSKLFSSSTMNIFIGLNTVMGLVLLDMYLRKRLPASPPAKEGQAP